jgi:hypothetical protein
MATLVKDKRFTTLGLFALFMTLHCSSPIEVRAPTDSLDFKISKRNEVRREEVSSESRFQHGYDGERSALSLVDQLAIEHKAGKLRETQGVSATEIDQWRVSPPSLIYSGPLLGLQNCAGLSETQNARHMAELWTQDYFLRLFSGDQIDWFFQAMHATHRTIVSRLKKGINPAFWSMNAVRFRIADRGTLNIGGDQPAEQVPTALPTSSQENPALQTDDLPLNTVEAQIKINYELDLLRAETDPTLHFFAAIHSIAITPTYVNEFIVDIMRIRQDPDLCGCDILNVLNKYVRNTGLKYGDPPRSSYFFMHTNALDKMDSVDEWRFAELKPVTNDYMDFAKRGEVEERVKQNLATNWMKHRIRTIDPRKGDPDFESIDYLAMGQFLQKLTISGNRKIFGPFDTPAGLNDAERALRIVPMSFPVFVAPSPYSDRIVLATNVKPISIWFSGTIIDHGRNARDGLKRINLLVDPNGNEVAIQHPGRRHEQTWTCAECHARQVSNRLQSVPGYNGALLDIVPFMNFRHIGYGDGGDKNCNGMFGVTREFFQPFLSEYLLEVANGYAIHKAAADYRKKGTLEIQNPGLGTAGKLDYFRCQEQRFDFLQAPEP